MSIDRTTRINELLRREIGEALYHLLDADAVDMASVTVTRVRISRNLRQARVLVSIRNHAGERLHMLARIQACRQEIQARIGRNMKLKYTPRLSFVLDPSVEQGDRVLALLDELGTEKPDDDAERGGPGPENGHHTDSA